jgi:hypothetical protein
MSSGVYDAESLRERARVAREAANTVSLVTDKERLLAMAECYEREAKDVEESERKRDPIKRDPISNT